MSDADPATPAASKSKGTYLPVLPEGYTYDITVTGPLATARITEQPQYDDLKAHVAFQATDGPSREQGAVTVAAAAADVAKGIKALVKVAEAEETLRAEREAALSVFGAVPPSTGTSD